MLRFDKAIYLSFLLISSVRLSNSQIRCFTILRIHKYSIHFCIIPLLNLFYIIIYVFSNFFCSIQRIYDLSDFI